jgi:hypothetical protein
LEFEGREIPAIKDEVEVLLLLVLLQATVASSLDDDDIVGSMVVSSNTAAASCHSEVGGRVCFGRAEERVGWMKKDGNDGAAAGCVGK